MDSEKIIRANSAIRDALEKFDISDPEARGAIDAEIEIYRDKVPLHVRESIGKLDRDLDTMFNPEERETWKREGITGAQMAKQFVLQDLARIEMQIAAIT